MKYLLIALVLLISQRAFSQFSGQTNALNITGPQSVLKAEIPLATPSVLGSTYLEDAWQQGEIVLKNGSVYPGLSMRVEIEQANVEILHNGEIKYLNLRHVDAVRITSGTAIIKSVLKRGSQFSLDGVPLKGIVMMLHEGKKYSVIKHLYIEFQQSNYNVALDVGSKDHKKVKKEKLFISQNGSLIAVKGSDRKIASKLGNDKDVATRVIDEHGLDLSNENDLVKFASLLDEASL